MSIFSVVGDPRGLGANALFGAAIEERLLGAAAAVRLRDCISWGSSTFWDGVVGILDGRAMEQA